MKTYDWKEILAKLPRLTNREWQVFECLGQGLSTRDIANLPGYKCSIKTVETFRTRLQHKLDLPPKEGHNLNYVAVSMLTILREHNITRVPEYYKVFGRFETKI